MKKLILLSVILFTVLLFGVFCDDEEEKEEIRPITEDWKEALLYGIDSEIIKVIEAIRDAGERSLDKDLLSILKESINSKVQRSILEYFSYTEYGEAEDIAISLLSDEEMEDTELIISLIHYLSAIDSGKSCGTLVDLIENEEQSIAQAAINALGKTGNSEIGAQLLVKLEDGDFPERLKTDIILALGELSYGEATEVLISIANNRDEERIRRMYACTALGKIGNSKAVPVLRSLFSEEDSLIKMYAASALSSFNMNEVQDLLIQGLKDSNVKVRIASAKALAHRDAKKAVEILIYKAKNDPEKQLRVQAIKTLGEIGTKEAYDFLRNLYQDKKISNLYREIAFINLVENDLKSSLKVINRVMDEEWNNKDQKVLEFTAKKLSQIQYDGLKSIFTTYLESKNFILRIYGIRGIGSNGFKDLRGEIKRLSEEDAHPAVRKVALSALGKF